MDNNTQPHIVNIDKAVQELRELQQRTCAPNQIQHQYIGTIIDSAIALLYSAANSIDGGNRCVKFNTVEYWKTFMAIIHRTFFSMIHAATELGIDTLSEEFKIKPKSSINKRFLEKIDKLQGDEKTIKQLKKIY